MGRTGSGKTDGLIKVNTKEDLTGQKFGRLTVIERGPDITRKDTRYAAWYCYCSCGNPEKLLIAGTMLKSKVKSCGCISKERFKNNNYYDLSGEYGCCTIKDRRQFIFDLEDYELIKKYRWHANARGYIIAKVYYPDKKGKDRDGHIFLHRLLMNVHNISWKECVVDHINGNVYDNRKSNLRVVTQSNNTMNSSKNSNNTSSITGVYKMNGKWMASICRNFKNYYLGIYDAFEDAVKARKEAEEKYFGEFSYDNSRLRRDNVAVN